MVANLQLLGSLLGMELGNDLKVATSSSHVGQLLPTWL